MFQERDAPYNSLLGGVNENMRRTPKKQRFSVTKLFLRVKFGYIKESAEQ
jgi:hypothetical protein